MKVNSISIQTICPPIFYVISDLMKDYKVIVLVLKNFVVNLFCLGFYLTNLIVTLMACLLLCLKVSTKFDT